MEEKEFVRQKQESIVGYSVLNKMTSLGIPEGHRVVWNLSGKELGRLRNKAEFIPYTINLKSLYNKPSFI